MEGPPTCSQCGKDAFEEGGFGIDFCLHCGIGKPGAFMNHAKCYFRKDRVMPKQCYTRLKRFKKYMFRAMRQQAASSVPPETWAYLLERGPYRDAKHVQLTLKHARHLKRKCYDSLPYLTAALCPHITVPGITEAEKHRGLLMFQRIDRAVQTGPFVSYLYCLEYILKRLDRHDVCEHINRIQCPKRRATYKMRLDKIFCDPDEETIEDVLRRNAVHPPEPL